MAHAMIIFMTYDNVTGPQYTYLTALLRKLDCFVDEGNQQLIESIKAQTNTMMTKTLASMCIERLKKIQPIEITTPDTGVYVLPNGSLVKLQENKTKTNVYALAWTTINGERLTLNSERVHGQWEYSPELKKECVEATRMTFEQAKAFTLVFGQCAKCGRKLKAAQSVEDGIGPVCKKYFRI